MQLIKNTLTRDVKPNVRTHDKVQKSKKNINMWIHNPQRKLEDLAPKVEKEFYSLSKLEKKLIKLSK
jgi:hypothetical protein